MCAFQEAFVQLFSHIDFGELAFGGGDGADGDDERSSQLIASCEPRLSHV